MADEKAAKKTENKATSVSTDANIWIQLIGALLLTALFAAGLSFSNKAINPEQYDETGHVIVQESYPMPLLRYINGLINERGPVQWAEVYCFFVVVLFIFLKKGILKSQKRYLASAGSDIGDVNMDNDEELVGLRKKIHDAGWNLKSLLMGRFDKGIELWLATKDVGRVSTWAGTESARDNGMSDLTFTLSRTMIWAIPIFGFIGTVQGLSSAVGGFADFLSGAAELSAIKGAIADVTIGLGVAFDTTFLALVLVMIVQFPLTSIMRDEVTLFSDVDVYLDEHFLSRLPSAGQQAVVIENLEDSIEAAFRRYIPDPDRYEEVFTESIEKAGDVVQKQFESFTEKYVEARKTATDNEVKALSEAMEHAHVQAMKLAQEYSHSADGIRDSLQASLEKAAQAAAGVSQQVSTITDLGGQIRDLLQIEKAMEKSLSGIAQADNFQKTLQQLREHLQSTDEFCRKISKPRVITFREEAV